MNWLVFLTLNAALNFNQQVTTKILNSGIWNGTGTNNYAVPLPNRYGNEFAILVDTVNYKQFFTKGQIDSSVAQLDSSFKSGVVAAKDSLDAVAVKQKAATVSTLLTLALSTLNGMKPPTTPTPAQQTAFFYLEVYKNGWINNATTKTDSALIRQWLSQ